MVALRAAKANAARRKIEGFTYHQEQQYAVMNAAASNEGAGGTAMSAGLGLGIVSGAYQRAE